MKGFSLTNILDINKCSCFIYKTNFSTKFQRSKIEFFSINVDFHYFSKESKFQLRGHHQMIADKYKCESRQHNHVAEGQQTELRLKISEQQRKCTSDCKSVAKVTKKFHTVTLNFERSTDYSLNNTWPVI